mmetsp:Transcript_9758/g.21715  ORF Transcript_9758/g.21715 Transcript_9758/m.21715 type:complete len:241 (-) Transcript_9758:126-848(-)
MRGVFQSSHSWLRSAWPSPPQLPASPPLRRNPRGPWGCSCCPLLLLRLRTRAWPRPARPSPPPACSRGGTDLRPCAPACVECSTRYSRCAAPPWAAPSPACSCAGGRPAAGSAGWWAAPATPPASSMWTLGTHGPPPPAHACPAPASRTPGPAPPAPACAGGSTPEAGGSPRADAGGTRLLWNRLDSLPPARSAQAEWGGSGTKGARREQPRPPHRRLLLLRRCCLHPCQTAVRLRLHPA